MSCISALTDNFSSFLTRVQVELFACGCATFPAISITSGGASMLGLSAHLEWASGPHLNLRSGYHVTAFLASGFDFRDRSLQLWIFWKFAFTERCRRI